MEKIGLVKSIDGNAAIIEIMRSGACGDRCSSCKSGCEVRAMQVRVKNNLNVSAGQLVKLRSDSKKLIKAIALVYMMPLVVMILGIVLGMMGAEYLGYSSMKEPIAVGVGVFSLLLSYLFLGYIDKKIKQNNEMEITISEVIR